MGASFCSAGKGALSAVGMAFERLGRHRRLTQCLGTVGLASMIYALSLGTSHAQSDQDLAAAAQNPVGNLISLPFQNNTLFGIGPNDEIVNVLNIQPVIPFQLDCVWSDTL